MARESQTIVLHPLIVRLTHWVWAIGIVILLMSGWRIYNINPFWGYGLAFPDWAVLSPSTEGSLRVHNESGLAGALLWHFAAMWLLFGAFLVFLAWGLVTGHFRRRYLPISVTGALADIGDFLRGRLAHDLGVRNTVQRLLYLVALVAMLAMILSGVAIWKPTQLSGLAALLGGYEGARRVHFIGMAVIFLFLVVHVVLTLLVLKVLPPMLTGRVRRDRVPPAVLGELR